ncbi:cell wall-associated NlpC family hydrolase [Bacillus niacini]|uniref:Cell wall-associated NlpC family hydrolase n=1 Tax=Neobacillus niacini TaxID=86668 RepID=A0A852TJK9_9BACI|nr:C40 family peptidase [Neobacillus niacini]NYE08365.1 cell wall-associated NlpC family hydrolase [Neobacillus niacini]
MIKKFLKYAAAAMVLATTIQVTPTFANPVTNGQIDATKEQINDFETKIQQLDNRISLAIEKSRELNEEIVIQQDKIEETEAEIVKAETALENHKKVYSERLKSIQLNGDQSVVRYAELLLSSGSVSEFFNRFTAISQFIESDTELLNGLNEKEQALIEAKEQLHTQIDHLKQNQVQLAAEQEQIEKDKQQIETDLAAAEGTLQAQLAQQEAEQQAAEQARQQLEQQQSLVTTTTTNTPAPALSPASATPTAVAANVASSATANAVIANAKQYLGVPYVWGGSTPSGFDCSGFVSYVYRSVGISLPRTSSAQQNVGTRVSLNQLQPGDLVFKGMPAYHVGIYIGGGQYIHAPQTGDVVKIAPFNPSKFSTASRILK